MIHNYIKLILIYTAICFGVAVSDLIFCHKGECTDMLQRAYSDILKIDWKPISVFPEERHRFQDAGTKQ